MITYCIYTQPNLLTFSGKNKKLIFLKIRIAKGARMVRTIRAAVIIVIAKRMTKYLCRDFLNKTVGRKRVLSSKMSFFSRISQVF